jgi:cytoskeleton protein RodZ
MTRYSEELRAERESRGVSVEDICAVTKLSPQNVRFLEDGRYGDLPGGVFRKGIVRSYVGALGLEETAWLERFEQSCRELGVTSGSERDWVEFAENVKKNRAPERHGMGWRWIGVILLLAALGAGAWSAWHYVVRKKIPQHTDPATSTLHPARDLRRSMRYLAVRA